MIGRRIWAAAAARAIAVTTSNASANWRNSLALLAPPSALGVTERTSADPSPANAAKGSLESVHSKTSQATCRFALLANSSTKHNVTSLPHSYTSGSYIYEENPSATVMNASHLSEPLPQKSIRPAEGPAT